MHIADQSNREKVQRQNTDINLKWTNTINSIDNQIETLSQIAQNWLDLERDIAAVEKSLLNITDKVKEIDFGQKSQSQLEEVKNNILVSMSLISTRIDISITCLIYIHFKSEHQDVSDDVIFMNILLFYHIFIALFKTKYLLYTLFFFSIPNSNTLTILKFLRSTNKI